MNNASTMKKVAPPVQNVGATHPEFAYKSVCKSAVASVVFAVLGALTSFLSEPFVLLPALGVGFGILALANFRRFPEELIGKLAAKIGLITSILFLVGSVSYHSIVYATEVPDGYQRIAFSDLRVNARTQLPFSEKALALDGQKVFLRGYVRPSAKQRKLKEFILVGDFGSCCFGGSPKITEVIAVNIIGDKTVDYGYALRRIGGTFRLNQGTRTTTDKDIPQVFYEIEADYVR